MSRTRKAAQYVIPIIFIIVGISLFTIRRWNQNDSRRASGKLLIALNDWAGYYPIVVAHNLGYFKKYNLDVGLVKTEDIEQTNLALAEGKVDLIATVAADALILRHKGNNVKILMALDHSISGDVVIADRSIKSFKDLKNKTIGISGLNTFSHLFVTLLLPKYGLKETDIQLKSIPVMQILNALENNEIAAGHTFDPISALAQAKGYHIIAKAGELPGIITDVLVYNAQKLNLDQAKGLIEAIFEAQTLLRLKPDLFLTSLKDFTPLSPQQTMDFINQIHVTDRNDNNIAFTESPKLTSLYGSLKKISSFYKSRGQILDLNLYKQLLEDSHFKTQGEPAK